ncbi:hypothetical protein [Ramlibacter sp.]|uniref:hypothetical protein n=1 Tax=Ramlibacter sp. TaxID=1917967 RepID=UPI0017F93FDB|nr:hypothetical protein [Ramlibacter sp.]MBA2675689.1 hypothetical protein [Ramlibacter sp.]
MKPFTALRSSLPLAGAAVTALLASCSSTPPLPPVAEAEVTQPVLTAAAAHSAPARAGARAQPSNAATPRAYRADAATHIYGLNRERIWKGRLPPMLYAVGVLQVEVDRNGDVRKLDWMRAPKHAPEVVAEIERTVRAAAPFPVPARMGKVVYTDTWLWHKSGRFQLDTLTEGQD